MRGQWGNNNSKGGERNVRRNNEMIMDKAKKISKDYADLHTCYANDARLQYLYTRKGVEFGYHQAEKDLELTWEDVHAIAIIEDKLIHELCLDDQTLPQTQEFYTEVLKRFKLQKGD